MPAIEIPESDEVLVEQVPLTADAVGKLPRQQPQSSIVAEGQRDCAVAQTPKRRVGESVYTLTDGTTTTTRPEGAEAEEPQKKKRRTIARMDSSAEPVIGESWVILPNDVKLGSDVKELRECPGGFWKADTDNNPTETKAGLAGVQVLELSALTSDDTFDVPGEQGVARRRLFGRVLPEGSGEA